MTTLILKNGFKFTGKILSEDSDKIILDDRKVGRVTVEISSVSARWEEKRWLHDNH